MANLFEILMGLKGKKEQGLDYKVTPLNKPLQAIQIADDGSVVKVEQPVEKPVRLSDRVNNLQSKLSDALLGVRENPTDAIGSVQKKADGSVQIDSTISANPRIGGLLPDIRAGYRENVANPLSMDNLNQKFTDDGRLKGPGYRFGEFAGTAARMLDNPLVRGAIAYGLSNRMGDRRPLVEALNATVGTQQNRMKDRAYRDSLINTAQQSRMASEDFGLLSEEQQKAELNAIADRINNYRGYIGDNVYGQMIQAQQLRDNAAYRNALLASNLKNREYEAQLARENLDYRKKQDAIENALKARGLNIQENKILQDNKPKKLEDLNAVSNQLKRFEDTFANMPNKLESNTLGRLRNMTGLQTEQEANFNSQRTLLFNKIARDLGGEKGVLSDQDIKRIENALPNYTDSYAQKQAKMQAIYALLEDRLSVEGASIQPQTNNDPLGIL